MDIVLKLRELRRMYGYSQREIASLSGIGEKTISSFETGDRIDSLKISQLHKILEVYGLSERDFFSDTLSELLRQWRRHCQGDYIGQMAELEVLPPTTRLATYARNRSRRRMLTSLPLAYNPPPDVARDWNLLNSRN